VRALRLLLPLLTLTAALCAQSPRSPISYTFAPEAEREMVRLVNRERQLHGLGTLVMDERLRVVAREHSALMATTGEVEHQLPGEAKFLLRLQTQALRYDTSGENIAFNLDAMGAHTALMHSPGHRANILETQFNSIGVGVLQTPTGIYVTEDFIRHLPEASVEEAEAKVAFHLNQLRRAAGAPALNRVTVPGLRERACAMAASNRLNPRALLSSRVANALAFTAIDLAQMPSSLEDLRTRQARNFAVGACYQSSATYENPVFWIVVVTYF
jgi:uncharacterized protein YkwD